MKKVLGLLLLLVMLASGLPVTAQTEGEARLRIVNLSAEAQSFSLIPSIAGAQQATIEGTLTLPMITDYYPISTEVDGIGLSITRGGGFSGSGFTAAFEAGHDYLLVIYDHEDSLENTLIDETGLFGDDLVALGEDAPLVLVHSLAVPAAYRFANSAGEPLFTQFVKRSDDSFNDELPIVTLGLAVGNYQLTVLDRATGTAVRENLALALSAGSPTMVFVIGNTIENPQVFVLSGTAFAAVE